MVTRDLRCNLKNGREMPRMHKRLQAQQRTSYTNTAPRSPMAETRIRSVCLQPVPTDYTEDTIALDFWSVMSPPILPGKKSTTFRQSHLPDLMFSKVLGTDTSQKISIQFVQVITGFCFFEPVSNMQSPFAFTSAGLPSTVVTRLSNEWKPPSHPGSYKISHIRIYSHKEL